MLRTNLHRVSRQDTHPSSDFFGISIVNTWQKFESHFTKYGQWGHLGKVWREVIKTRVLVTIPEQCCHENWSWSCGFPHYGAMRQDSVMFVQDSQKRLHPQIFSFGRIIHLLSFTHDNELHELTFVQQFQVAFKADSSRDDCFYIPPQIGSCYWSQWVQSAWLRILYPSSSLDPLHLCCESWAREVK